MAVLQWRETAAGKLTFIWRTQMSQTEFERESKHEHEPLLPIEKKLIGWSLGIGVVSLTILVAINHFAPLTF
jgi:hypothetical protein